PIRSPPNRRPIEYHRFDDVPHGFCASHSNFTNGLMARREAIANMHAFFAKNPRTTTGTVPRRRPVYFSLPLPQTVPAGALILFVKQQAPLYQLL
ncbi:hypothetical protein HK405_011487, partial [Cladochytrium tenue]